MTLAVNHCGKWELCNISPSSTFGGFFRHCIQTYSDSLFLRPIHMNSWQQRTSAKQNNEKPIALNYLINFKKGHNILCIQLVPFWDSAYFYG